jgi:hypothetical protein
VTGLCSAYIDATGITIITTIVTAEWCATGIGIADIVTDTYIAVVTGTEPIDCKALRAPGFASGTSAFRTAGIGGGSTFPRLAWSY